MTRAPTNYRVTYQRSDRAVRAEPNRGMNRKDRRAAEARPSKAKGVSLGYAIEGDRIAFRLTYPGGRKSALATYARTAEAVREGLLARGFAFVVVERVVGDLVQMKEIDP